MATVGDVEDSVIDADYRAEDPQINDELKAEMEAWREAARGRPLRILVSGLGGVGKSTLVNLLLHLPEDQKAKEGIAGEATTRVVFPYVRTTESGIRVCIFDTPGFDDIDMSDEEIVAQFPLETGGEVDLVFYCISLKGAARVQRSDVKAMTIMTRAFTSEMWKKAVIVLTFANNLEGEVKNKTDYERVITSISDNVKRELREKAHVSDKIVAQVPILTAGHTDPILKHEADECEYAGGWVNRLILKALEQVNPRVFPAFFEIHFSWNKFWENFTNPTSTLTSGLMNMYTILRLMYIKWKLSRP